jgi:hypothetical protein
MHPPKTQVLYFQQLLPLSECDAKDGRLVGHLLMDLVESKPKDAAHAIRVFAGRTAMLRDCGFGHIGAMLTRLLCADVQGDTTAISTMPGPAIDLGFDPSSLTEKQAIAIGSAITSSVRETPGLATALKRVCKAHAVLQVMKSEHGWFVPMLEVVLAHKATEPRGSVLMKRVRSRSSRIIVVAPISSDAASNVYGADGDSGFSSVVRLVLCAQELIILEAQGLRFAKPLRGVMPL